ncbi:DUF5127 domain-containing protein [Streptomyces sp. V4-01]|uniref:DUF5127 domain-containing protein n=1 Tax=Actinacidiphila polyblastidii TaxID=3110430 RepID=A0ABU7PJT4_9ACTN|nr:DUF5127 domain-containing protein [Streptomyces sp. V4-01]
MEAAVRAGGVGNPLGARCHSGAFQRCHPRWASAGAGPPPAEGRPDPAARRPAGGALAASEHLAARRPARRPLADVLDRPHHGDDGHRADRRRQPPLHGRAERARPPAAARPGPARPAVDRDALAGRSGRRGRGVDADVPVAGRAGRPAPKSMPLPYIPADVRSVDGAAHDVALYVDISGEWAHGTSGTKIGWSQERVPGSDGRRAAAGDQRSLAGVRLPPSTTAACTARRARRCCPSGTCGSPPSAVSAGDGPVTTAAGNATDATRHRATARDYAARWSARAQDATPATSSGVPPPSARPPPSRGRAEPPRTSRYTVRWRGPAAQRPSSSGDRARLS